MVLAHEPSPAPTGPAGPNKPFETTDAPTGAFLDLELKVTYESLDELFSSLRHASRVLGIMREYPLTSRNR